MTWEICKYILSILYFVFCVALILTTYNGVKKNDDRYNTTNNSNRQ